MTEDQPFRLCWSRDQANRIFKTEALEGDDAVFLATHSPIRGFDVIGRGAAEIAQPDEESILHAMAEPDRRHAFCVVLGEPGSGKSHLIRWLSVNWPHANDVKLLLRRADGSLEGALGQLRERLPEEFHTLFEGLGVRQRASLQGRANNFLSWLANTLAPDHYEDPVGGEDWCQRHRPGEILSHERIKQHWQAPTRILKLLDGASGERNSASASFNVFDVAEIGNIAQPIRHTFGAAARDLARRLQQESDLIGEYREAGWQADDLAAERKEEIPFTVALAEVLNRRRNDAIQNVLGVSAAGLKTLFRRVRQQLKTAGRRLVLLLEDITSWEGLDDSLIDVLTFNSEASGGEEDTDVCPLISVVGLTPAYFDKMQGNYKQRITHEIRLGQSDGGLQDVASLRDANERVNFVTRYLAAVRTGDTRLRAWRDDLRAMPALPPPNMCDACEKRPACHAIFGENKGVGLFPFNGTALDRFFEALKTDDNGQTWRTPRGILQTVLSPTLSQPELLEEGGFPGRIIESSAIERTRLPENAVSGRLGAIVAGAIEDEGERARFRRAVSFWGDPENADTVEQNGELSFAGMSKSLMRAFDLPWLGGVAAASGHALAPLRPEVKPPSGDTKGNATQDGTDSSSGGARELTGVGKVIRRQDSRSKIAPPSRNKRTQSVREQMREELRNWAGGGALSNSSRWNDLLYELISALDPRAMGVNPFVFSKVVTSQMVKLQGSTSAQRQYLVIPPEDWVREGLEAVLDLEYRRRAMSEGDVAYARRNIALMMRRLQSLVTAYLRSRLPLNATGSIWSAVGTMAQVLQARAWLRGTVAPDAPVLDQMRAILSDEDAAQSDPQSRSAPWMSWLDATRPWQERMRTELRSAISLALDGGAAGAALLDTSELTGAVARMRERGLMDEVPAANGALPDGMAKARELVEQWKNSRSRIIQTEFGQIKNRSQTIGDLLRHYTISAHLERLDQAISKTSTLLPHAAANLVAIWAKEKQRLFPRIEPDLEKIENLIVAFDDESGIPASLPLRLKWLSSAPARALEETLALVQAGERAVSELHEHARDCILDGRQSGSLATVKEIGRRLREVATDETEKAGTV